MLDMRNWRDSLSFISFSGNYMDIKQRLRLFLNVILIVAVLVLAKMVVHVFRVEFFILDTLFSSIVASAIFIVGFLLTSTLPDFKEAERIPSDIRTALEAMHDDVCAFAVQSGQVDVMAFRRMLVAIVKAIDAGLGIAGHHSHLENAEAQADRLAPFIARLDALGMPQNFVVRLRGELDVVRRSLYRIHYIQKIEFVPSIHVLVQSLVCAVLFMLLFLKTDGSFGTAAIFGFVSYLFVFAMHLVAIFAQPYRQGEHSVDKVSLFVLRDFLIKMDALISSTPATASLADDTKAVAPPHQDIAFGAKLGSGGAPL